MDQETNVQLVQKMLIMRSTHHMLKTMISLELPTAYYFVCVLHKYI